MGLIAYLIVSVSKHMILNFFNYSSEIKFLFLLFLFIIYLVGIVVLLTHTFIDLLITN